MAATNPFIKQFQNLVQGKRIMYVHGFGSSAQSGTVALIRQTLPAAEVIAFDLPIAPHEAIGLLQRKCREIQPDIIIGTSMGGMYAEQLHGYDRILINPAFNIADTMREHNMMGKQTFFSPREDGVQEFYVDKPLLKAYREVADQCFSEEDKEHVWGLFGDNDPVVHTFDLFSQHYPRAIRFHGEHRLNDGAFMNAIVPVIRWIDDRQEGRSRPIVFVSFGAMHDSYEKPVSSLAKAVNHLIENYNVYFLAQSPTNDHDYFKKVQEWLFRHIAVPAYDHVVFTNQPYLLYGDYFIADGNTLSQSFTSPYLGTVIEIGTDEFKNWEEIIVFFDRLGGQ